MPIDRIEVVEARRPLPLADRELAFLQSVGDVPKIGYDEAVTHACLRWRQAFLLRRSGHYANPATRRSTRAGRVATGRLGYERPDHSSSALMPSTDAAPSSPVQPFEPNSVDLLFSRFGVVFFSDPAAAFANVRRAMKPGGRVALAVFRAPRRQSVAE
jgi:hypothetical protein